MTEVEQPEPQPSLIAKSVGAVQALWKFKHLVPTAAYETARYFTTGAPHDTWPLSVALFCAVARYSVETARAERRLHDGDKEIDPVEEMKKRRKGLKGLESAEIKNGAIVETSWKVQKRGLKGVLEEADGSEDGTREVKAEWSIHESLLGNDIPSTNDKVVLFLHGGGYVVLSPKSHRPLCMQLSRELGCRILSVDYRLAPETKFPGALHDAVSAYHHLTEDLNVPPSKIIVAGDSAGGNLATALMLYLRDEGLPQVSGGVLLSPWVDFTHSFASWDSNKNSDYLAMDQTDPMNPSGLFVPSPSYLTHPYISPSISGSLSNLPPLIVLSGGSETLRDEITVFSHRADRDGTDVTYEVFEGGVHVFVAVMREGMGREGIRTIGNWAREKRIAMSDVSRGKIKGERWNEVGKMLEDAWEKRRSSLPSSKQKGKREEKKPEEERFIWEYSVEDAPEVELREGANEVAVKALEEMKQHPARKGLTKVVRGKKNAAFKGGRLHL